MGNLISADNMDNELSWSNWGLHVSAGPSFGSSVMV